MEEILTPEQGRILPRLARTTLEHRFSGRGVLQEPEDPVFRSRLATFVTLKLSGQLRGCIGNLTPVGTLWDGVRDNALNAAFHDHRFAPLQAVELSRLRIEISILSPPKPLSYQDADDLPHRLRPGQDGVILREGWHSATFLPQVWEQLPRPEQFLDHLCLKAGLPKRSWRERKLAIETYQVQSFAEEE